LPLAYYVVFNQLMDAGLIKAWKMPAMNDRDGQICQQLECFNIGRAGMIGVVNERAIVDSIARLKAPIDLL
jgi:hypothetical protein